MPSDKPEMDGFLAVIEAKIAALKTLAESYRAAVALGALGQLGDLDIPAAPLRNGVAASGSLDLPTGAFLGKSIPAAIKLYLSIARRKQTIGEIAAGLKEGGVESTSDNFEGVITGALNRLKVAGEVLRFKDGWGLAEFYPESLRNRITQETKPKEKEKKPRRKSARARKIPREESEPTPKRTGPTIDQRVLSLLATGPCTPAAVSEKLQAPLNVVNLTLGRLVSQRRAEKTTGGAYVPAKAADPGLRAV